MSFAVVKLLDPVQLINIPSGLVPKGAYAAGTDYAVGDSVDYNGSSYVMFADAAAGTLPTDTTKWQVLANKGDTGATGATGSTGSTGSTGPKGDTGSQGIQGEVGLTGSAGADGSDGQGVPVGGTTNQVLAKIDGTDFNTAWVDPAAGSGAVDSVNGDTGTVVLTQDDIGDGTTYKQYSTTEKTKLSGIEAGADVTDATNVTAAGAVMTETDPVFSAWDKDYADLTNTPTIPSAYTLPTADATTLGGVKVGSRLSISSGVLSADVQSTDISGKLDANTPITGATKTKITYDADGLVTSGADATTADIADSTNKRYVTDANLTVIGNTSGTNSGDQTTVSGNAGTATTLATPRAIYGNNFDGSAALTQIIASTYGGTGNGFTKFSGAASTEKTYTLPNATATILTSNAAVTVAQGGTGRATGTTAYGLVAVGTTATGAQQTISPGTSGHILKSAGASALPAFGAGAAADVGLGNVTNVAQMPIAGGTFTGATEAADHGTDSTDQLVNVSYGTGSPPTASTTTEGSLFIQYTP